MRVSIITVNYNNKSGLEDTIRSVENQVFKDYEFLIIDGGSSDGSKALIEAKTQLIDYWVSEQEERHLPCAID